LAILGFFASALGTVASPISLLVICSGLSVVLGAFGATATLNYQGFAVAGVAALSMALFAMVMPELRFQTALVEVAGFPRGARVDLYAGGLHFLGAERGERHDLYQFVVFAEDLRAGMLGLTDTVPANSSGTPESDLIFNCIAREDVARGLGLGSSLQWRVDAPITSWCRTPIHPGLFRPWVNAVEQASSGLSLTGLSSYRYLWRTQARRP
jgi:hypothetical protein